MLPYCLKCRKKSKSKNPEVVKTKNGRIMPLSKCSLCNSKNSKFPKEQEARGLLIGLGIRTLLRQITLLGTFFKKKYKMNEIIDFY